MAKKIIIFLIIIVIIITVLIIRDHYYTEAVNNDLILKNMNITSSVFKNNQSMPAKYTCDSEDINPPLVISGTPNDTKSIVLIVDDPDAPMGTFLHWTVWNIDPATTEINENSIPSGGVEGNTDFGQTGWGGPCPPTGSHRYFFKIYALDTKLDLPKGANLRDLESAMESHVMDKAELIGLYQRNK